MGLREGVRDALGGGNLVASSVEYIARVRPKLFLLENVPGILTVHQGLFF